jgi:hypothetical protein
MEDGLLNKLPVFLPSNHIGRQISDLAISLNSEVEKFLLS